MCGINAIISNSPIEETYIRSMNYSLAHRGPDDSGYKSFDNDKIWLGHRRLSIIDLSKDGHQPMPYLSERYWITFNGEIYNYSNIKNQLLKKGYTFKTKTDTEVILAAYHEYGVNCLNLFEGMWAFVIYDTQNGEMFASVDPFGIKPFYYSINDGKLYISSEIKTILSAIETTDFDFQSIYEYLMFSKYDTSEKTFFENIYQLKAGNFFKLNVSDEYYQVIQNRYWHPNIELIERTEEQAVEELREILIESVSMHMNSDVEVSFALSGGIDSSAIVCIARHLYPNLDIHTFSYISKDKKSEEKWIDIINKYNKCISHKVYSNGSIKNEEVIDLLNTQDEPFGSTSIYAQYLIFKEVNKNNIKVLLEGQGADELFAGYKGYPSSRIMSLWHEKSYIKLLDLLYNWQKYPGNTTKEAFFHLFRTLIPNEIYNYIRNKKNKKIDELFLSKNIDKKVQFRSYLFEDNFQKNRSLAHTLMKESTEVSLRSLLRHSDRNSMRWSVESRVPFLNRKLAEFCYSLDEKFLLSEKGQTKYILRKALKGIVPDIILERRDKIGFETESIILPKLSKNYVQNKNNDVRVSWRYFNLNYFLNFWHNDNLW